MSIMISMRLSSTWVLSHRGDEVLPIDFLKNELFSIACDAKIVRSSHTELTVLVGLDESGAKELSDRLCEIFARQYGLDEHSGVLSVKLEQFSKTVSESEESAATEETKSASASPEMAKVTLKPSNDKDPKTEEKSAVDACMKRIEAMTGGSEFKAFARELCAIAPYIKQNNAFDTFLGQTYLFSINNGYGMTSYLNALADLLVALKISPAFTKPTVIETRVPAPRGKGEDPFSDVNDTLGMGSANTVRILSIDISEWIDNTNHVDFKAFLSNASRHVNEFILVFRVPFVDKDVLEKMRRSLNDLIFVKSVSFPPLTKGEIQSFAKSEIEAYGFRMSSAAWEGFHQRISEERSDGRFYGLNTVKKVVRELLYTKQLSNAKRGRNDLLISKKDAIAICEVVDGIGLTGYQMLDRLVCADSLKERINEIVSQILVARADKSIDAPCIHMRFVGNPGTGKTTVARILGKILKEKGVLRVGGFFEYGGRDFCGRYVGETAPKTVSMCRDAYGSVLFIDEAYSLYRGGHSTVDYGREALDALIAEMENHRSDLVVIMAGYPDEMETLMEGNAGLESRMPYVIEFPNFSRDQLYEIYVSMVNKRFKGDEALFSAAKAYFDTLPEQIIGAKEFSNARFVRNLFERTWAKAAMRCQLAGQNEVMLVKDDFDRATADKEFNFNVKKKAVKIGF